MAERSYDLIGIGIGPFNLGLAALMQPLKTINTLFIDQKPDFNWHPEMMLENSTLQTPFLSDLVTLAAPTHPLSFLNYIKQQGRIYSFYIRENFFLMRKEYNQYCQWVVTQLSNLRFNTCAEAISYDEKRGIYRVHCTDIAAKREETFTCKKIVLGIGSTPFIPLCCQPFVEKMFTSSGYLKCKALLQQKKRITILGSGQSAAEIFYDLLQDSNKFDYQLNWVTRSPRFFPMEDSKLTLEMTSPDYIDYFYSLSTTVRDGLNLTQKNLYKGINNKLINAIFDLLYIKRLDGELKVNLYTCSALQKVTKNNARDGFTLFLLQQEQDKLFTLDSQNLLLATGYQYKVPNFIQAIQQRIRWDKKGRYAVQRNYSIDYDNRIFIQNAELHTHGFVAPDLGMACYRNACLIREITGVEHYPIERKVCFQQFGI